MDSRLRGIRSEFNDQVEELSGALTSQMAVVHQQIDDLTEKLNSNNDVPRSTEDNLRDRVKELVESEIERIRPQPIVTTDQLRG